MCRHVLECGGCWGERGSTWLAKGCSMAMVPLDSPSFMGLLSVNSVVLITYAFVFMSVCKRVGVHMNQVRPKHEQGQQL